MKEKKQWRLAHAVHYRSSDNREKKNHPCVNPVVKGQLAGLVGELS